VKLCKDCKHYENSTPRSHCHAMEGQTNPITGESLATISADLMRIGILCGWDEPKLWEAKDQP
jgi:hypothetical protein